MARSGDDWLRDPTRSSARFRDCRGADMSHCRSLLFRCAMLALLFASLAAAQEPLRIRGYYFTFSRVQTWPLAEWKKVFDNIHEDGGNLVILWIGGGFKSRLFPITWQYNREHQNIRQDFVRSLIDYAHERQIRVLLGFTPSSYDVLISIRWSTPSLRHSKKTAISRKS